MNPLQDPIQLPRDAKLTSLLLSSLGQSNYSPLVLHQLLELSHRHMTLHLQDALLYAEHADRREISVDDLKLARKVGGGVPSKDVFLFSEFMTQALMEIADKKNAMPLPQVPEKFGLRLPVERHTLTAPSVTLNPVQVMHAQLMIRKRDNRMLHLQYLNRLSRYLPWRLCHLPLFQLLGGLLPRVAFQLWNLMKTMTWTNDVF